MALNNAVLTSKQNRFAESGVRTTTAEKSDDTHDVLAQFGRQFQRFGYVASLICGSVVLMALVLKLYLSGLLLSALLCGMAESRGRCGISHIGMIAPWNAIDKRTWFKCCLSYTIVGACTAYIVGLLIAGLGSWVKLGSSPFYHGLIGLLCVVFLVRDLGWLRFKAPQCDRQTHKKWVHQFGVVTGSGMWGAHIGLAVATVVTYSGLYCLIAIAFGMGLRQGEWLLLAFWFGRVVFLWGVPWLTNSSSNGMAIGIALERSDRSFRLCSMTGMTSMLVISMLILFERIW